MFKSSKKYWLIIVVAIALMAWSVHRSLATPLAISNWNFDDVVIANGTSGPIGNIQGWVGTGVYGAWNPGSAAFNNSTVFDESTAGNVAWVNSGYISQILPYNLTTGHLYTLSVDVGYQASCTMCTSFVYTIELLAGGISLNTYSGTGKVGEWETASLTYSALADGGPLEIRLYTIGKRTHFDNVSLIDSP